MTEQQRTEALIELNEKKSSYLLKQVVDWYDSDLGNGNLHKLIDEIRTHLTIRTHLEKRGHVEET